MNQITITLPDKSQRTVDQGSTPGDIALTIGEGLFRNSYAAKIDGELVDLNTAIQNDCDVQILTNRDKESHDILLSEEADKILDDEVVTRTALEAVQENGIVFLDEIDKVCARSDARGADVSREGVQRDLLPLIEGTTVSTKHGPIKTDHILFIASGAFHVAKPSDLLPELQGRLPNRVELKALGKDDFIRILKEPEQHLLLLPF